MIPKTAKQLLEARGGTMRISAIDPPVTLASALRNGWLDALLAAAYADADEQARAEVKGLVTISEEDFMAFVQIATRYAADNPKWVCRNMDRTETEQDPLGAHRLVKLHRPAYQEMWKERQDPEWKEKREALTALGKETNG